MKTKLLLLGLLIITLAIPSTRIFAQCCVAPANLKVTSIGRRNADLQWQRVFQTGCTRPTTYRVQYRKLGDTVWIPVIVKTMRDDKFGDTTVRGLKPATTYQWRVQGICSSTNKTAFVKGANFTTLALFASEATTSSTKNFSMIASPNPVHGQFTLSISSGIFAPANITITSVTGMEVFHKTYTVDSHNYTAVIDASRFPNGLYRITAQMQSEIVSLNVLKN